MKKIIGSFILALFVLSSACAAVISTPAATVNLTKNKVITMTQLTEQVKSYEDQGYVDVDPREVLDSMIESVLIEQGAERDGYSISDAELNTVYANQKLNVDSQAGRTLTDAEFEALVRENYGSVDAYKAYLKEQYVLQNYVFNAKADIANTIAEPTDKEIKAWYRQNATSTFTEPEMVRLSVIAKAKTGDAAKDKANLATLTKAMDDITKGTVSFERAVQLYSEDTSTLSTGGDWGFLVDQESTRVTMGNAFVDEAMLLEEGEVIGVRETPSLYVIAKCTVHLDPRILGLDDIMSGYGITVTEYIREGLLYQNSQIAFYDAYEALVAELKSQARINILYK